eukprot:CAMPEP_0201701470 /NCGR_PEP_ID=MMETSP0578-20130828/32752_1 /ASSEMBLY_ACC=CAM_ASM_000663 /TAXON_ID=267565 /ORGANISM="Skeletonema grethea, Strain CCMP 1804" /LENGTH=297 /DNA_ID=CAMNT_0048188793 /DNA_START=138 /DNA_END=1027 /DNA_ORIENTATION=+
MPLNSPNKEVLQTRFTHLTNEWFQRDPYILSVFVKEGIKSWYDYVSFVVNLDEINSVKNRNDSYQDDDDGEYSGDPSAIGFYWRNIMLHSVSYVNELQIMHGPLNDGLVDIRDHGFTEFCLYCDGNPPFQAFTNDLAREHAAKARQQSFLERKASAEARRAEAAADLMQDKAYGGSSAGTLVHSPDSFNRRGTISKASGSHKSDADNLHPLGTIDDGDNLSSGSNFQGNPLGISSFGFTGIPLNDTGIPFGPSLQASTNSSRSHHSQGPPLPDGHSHHSASSSSSSRKKKKKKKKKP